MVVRVDVVCVFGFFIFDFDFRVVNLGRGLRLVGYVFRCFLSCFFFWYFCAVIWSSRLSGIRFSEGFGT